MTLGDLQARDPVLVLASASATRRAILAECGLRFAVIEPHVDEGEIKRRFRRDGLPAAAAALALAEAKAVEVSLRHPDALVIGCDQILSCGDEWFDKPVSLDDARHQLGRLRGRSQCLHSAVVLRRGSTTCWTHVAEPEITLRLASDAVLDAYVAEEGEALLSCVGACRIEGPGQMLIDRIVGERTAILGLPLLPLLAALRDEGVLPN